MGSDTMKDEQYYVDIISGLAERTIKRLWIALILTIALLVGTNIAWIVYENQFEDVSITAEQTADNGSNNYAIGGDYLGGNAESND